MPRVNVKDKRKQQLIDANIASIAKRGLSETTIAHVSQGAGMSRGIVNFYFTTKESMMQETCQYLADEYAAAWERALEKHDADANPEAALRAMVAAQFTSALCNQKKLAVWVAFWAHASSHKDYQKIVSAANSAFEQKLAELWQKLDSRLEAEVFAHEMYALIRGAWLKFLLAAQVSEREALAARCDGYITRALDNAGVQPVAEKQGQYAVGEDADGAVAATAAQGGNVTDIASAKNDKTHRKKLRVQEDEQPALGDLFALGL